MPAIDAFGINADTWIHEVGLSQYEINLVHGDPLQLADQAFLFKYAAKEIAIKHGMNAVFMAKPIAGQPGSSMHLHQSVVDAQGKNIFSNPDGSNSAAFYHFIGGLQAYLPDLMLIFAPSVNSFRRFIPGSQAPINLQWGEDNRTAGLRIPLSGPAARRVENRIAGADANPYLAIAASLAAGLAGIEEQLAPGKAVVGSAYDCSHDLAHTFLAAHAQMSDSASARRLLGDNFVTAFSAVKQLEYQSYLYEIGAWERRFLAATNLRIRLRVLKKNICKTVQPKHCKPGHFQTTEWKPCYGKPRFRLSLQRYLFKRAQTRRCASHALCHRGFDV